MNDAARRCWRIVRWPTGLVLWALAGLATACEPHVWNDVGYYVPGVRGDSESNARECLQKFGYAPQRGGDVPSKLPAGTVDHTEPAAGTTPVPAGQDGPQVNVTYFLSSGELEIPDVVGMRQARGESTIVVNGFRVGNVDKQPDEGPAGQILHQTPRTGTAPPGTTIDLVVSKENPTVPDVVGDEESVGTAELSNAGFAASLQGTEDSEKRSGLITRTKPAAGTRARPGGAVGYWVTSGRNAVPNLSGMTREQATRRLAAAGFLLGQSPERVRPRQSRRRRRPATGGGSDRGGWKRSIGLDQQDLAGSRRGRQERSASQDRAPGSGVERRSGQRRPLAETSRRSARDAAASRHQGHGWHGGEL